MQRLHVGAAVLNQTPLDWKGNTRRIREVIQEARRRGVAILCLPELCITGYGCEDAFHAPYVVRQAWNCLLELSQETGGLVVSFGLPVAYHGAVYNCAALVADRRILGLVAKQNLAGDGIHYEPRWFKPWPAGEHVSLRIEDHCLPLGELVFDLSGVRIGFEICEDAWVAERPGCRLARAGVDVILNPSASHFAFGKQAIRKRFVQEGARAFHAAYVYANLLGNEAGRAIYDGDALIACGQRLAVGRRFSFREWLLVSDLVDLDVGRVQRARLSSYRPAIGSPVHAVLDPFAFPSRLGEPHVVPADAWENGPFVKHEEFTRAVSLGLYDYLRKSRSRGFVVSLSGGADSSAVAFLAGCALKLAWNECGPEQIWQQFPYLPHAASPEQAMPSWLTCVYQATRHSGPITRQAAQAVAESLGARFYYFDVDPIVQGYQQLVEAALGRRLDWQTDDVALQNIQARARSPSVWLLANVQGGLLLSTSNRSEAAVGYATMDGDTSGGLAPIAGIDKAFLLEWLRWVEKQGPEQIGPLPALSAVTSQQPTAELRPAEYQQTDEADLMPYPILDAIERSAIRDKLSPKEVLIRLQELYPDLSLESLRTWVNRFFRLWSRNQWKRERYAPSFHLDDENLDPKTWCRFPILSGGFEAELEDLADRDQGEL
ncbi:MAG: NAD(+) synthase [Pirellulaceae bacterium]|nr:MAG: NAD(+) synthase [Pirellulaceae bacterium]